ncbi:hypothetical protein [Escherichia coli]|uniref:hypothetical protein n=1 Tax=Escherichia coli TaxID=562 RepID=UPI003F76A6BA
MLLLGVGNSSNLYIVPPDPSQAKNNNRPDDFMEPGELLCIHFNNMVVVPRFARTNYKARSKDNKHLMKAK